MVDSQLRARSQRRIVTLDVVHDDDVALVADLERRLGGRVVRHQVDEVDYVRDTMEVEVTYRVWTPVVHPNNPAEHAAHDGTVNGSAQFTGQFNGQVNGHMNGVRS